MKKSDRVNEHKTEWNDVYYTINQINNNGATLYYNGAPLYYNKVTRSFNKVPNFTHLGISLNEFLKYTFFDKNAAQKVIDSMMTNCIAGFSIDLDSHTKRVELAIRNPCIAVDAFFTANCTVRREDENTDVVTYFLGKAFADRKTIEQIISNLEQQ
jgi:hypothetical protein